MKLLSVAFFFTDRGMKIPLYEDVCRFFAALSNEHTNIDFSKKEKQCKKCLLQVTHRR